MSIHRFRTADELAAWLERRFPQRQGTNVPGLYLVTPDTIVAVRGLTIRVFLTAEEAL